MKTSSVILIVSGSLNSVPSSGGDAPAKVIMDTIKHLDKNKFQVLSHYSKNLNSLDYDSEVFKHVKVTLFDKLLLLIIKLYFPFKRRKERFTTAQDLQLLYFIAASRFIRRNKYKKVIVHVSTGMVQMIKLFNPKCEVVFYHHGTSLHTKQTEHQWRMLLKNTVAIFGVNQAAASFANDFFKTKLPPNHYFKIGNGVDRLEFAFQNQFSSKKLFQILFSGRICKEKGVLELIKAYKILKEKDYNISLIIAGGVGTVRGLESGNMYLKICKKYIEEHNLEVIFTGFLPQQELYELYKNVNVVVLPTDPNLSLEGMSLSLLEAMSMGKPLIATNVGGNPEVIHNGHNGFLIYKTEDYSTEIADRIEELYLNKELENTMIENSIKIYNTNFTTEIMSKNFLKALKEINYVE